MVQFIDCWEITEVEEGKHAAIILDEGEIVVNVADVLSRDYAGNLVVHETAALAEEALAGKLKDLGYVKLKPGEVAAKRRCSDCHKPVEERKTDNPWCDCGNEVTELVEVKP